MTLSHIQYILGGIGISLSYTIISFMVGCTLGLLLALGMLSEKRWIKQCCKVYLSVFRGTPLLVQISLAYFVLPSLTGLDISGFTAGILAFSLNSAAYVAEIFRGGIQSVDAGQFLASRTLGIPYFYKMRDIILPQALRAAFPALVNEVISLLKETALISTIGVSDIMHRAHVVAAEQYNYLPPLLVAAASYYILVSLISVLANQIERSKKHDYLQVSF